MVALTIPSDYHLGPKHQSIDEWSTFVQSCKNRHGNFVMIAKIAYLINISFLYQSAWPDVITQDLTSDHEFIVLACDGKTAVYSCAKLT